MDHVQAKFPHLRLRRLRRNAAVRELVTENRLTVSDLIWPIFLTDGQLRREDIPSMPGVQRLSIDLACEAAREAQDMGIPTICLFPKTAAKDKTELCEEAWNPDNLTNKALRAIKESAPDLTIMTDIALDPYNALGHDGIVKGGEIVNDLTIEALVKQGLEQARNGADILGPSDMMDGRIGALRSALEAEGFGEVAILSYAAKYASSFYGPFRDAVGASGALKGDKKTYQINPANATEGLRCVARDLAEGADMVMVKPGMPYLDMCTRVKERFEVPTFAYQVSGEYAMIMAAAQNGWIDEEAAMLESLLCFKRAGCDGILSYFAPRVARLLAQDHA